MRARPSASLPEAHGGIARMRAQRRLDRCKMPQIGDKGRLSRIWVARSTRSSFRLSAGGWTRVEEAAQIRGSGQKGSDLREGPDETFHTGARRGCGAGPVCAELGRDP